MEAAELGVQHAQYNANGEEWGRSFLACGAMITMGAFGFVLACYRYYTSGSPNWILLLIGPLLAGVGGYVLFQVRPRLLSLAIHEGGLLIKERGGDTVFRWNEVTRIEESVDRAKSANIHQVFVETVGETNLLVNSTSISSFDEFLSKLRQRAAEHDLVWVDVNDKANKNRLN
jgi:hypothetical protein